MTDLPLHGQTARAAADGATELSAAKRVEHGARAQILLLPGHFRLDVRSHPDAFEALARSLGDPPGEWETAGPQRWTFRDGAITAQISLHSEPEAGGRRFEARALVRNADILPDRP